MSGRRSGVGLFFGAEQRVPSGIAEPTSKKELKKELVCFRTDLRYYNSQLRDSG